MPELLIVGPQKTGTTALYTYLKLNPVFKSAQMSPLDFEEVQFFNDKHYYNGVDWYFDRFKRPTNTTAISSTTDKTTLSMDFDPDDQTIYFEKSATYFDDPKVPPRAFSLLPDARIVILLVDPADRAYSWYQHIKAHGDPVANSMSFEQVIMSSTGDTSTTTANVARASTKVISVRQRCLHPGYYSQHLTNWLNHYPSRQIIIIDGQWFKYNPVLVMNRLQLLLRVNKPLDYANQLVYNEQKGFYCQRLRRDSHNDGIHCLGKSKGRKYAPMSQKVRLYLNRHYLAHNRQLAQLLSDIGQPLPVWLDEAMTTSGLGLASSRGQ